jgi:hypothetical protein
LKFEAKAWDLLSCDTDKDECREKKEETDESLLGSREEDKAAKE